MIKPRLEHFSGYNIGHVLSLFLCQDYRKGSKAEAKPNPNIVVIAKAIDIYGPPLMTLLTLPAHVAGQNGRVGRASPLCVGGHRGQLIPR